MLGPETSGCVAIKWVLPRGGTATLEPSQTCNMRLLECLPLKTVEILLPIHRNNVNHKMDTICGQYGGLLGWRPFKPLNILL